MIEIKLKRILITIVLTLAFLLGNTITFIPQFNMVKGSKFNVAYAAPKGSSGGFKSGGFSTTPKSSSPSGGFKSGGFSNATPKSSGGYSSGGFFNTKPKTTMPSGGYSYNTGRSWSFFPIPIPIPFGNRGYFGSGYGIGFGIFSFFWSIIKIIILIAIILWVIKRSRRR